MFYNMNVFPDCLDNYKRLKEDKNRSVGFDVLAAVKIRQVTNVSKKLFVTIFRAKYGGGISL